MRRLSGSSVRARAGAWPIRCWSRRRSSSGSARWCCCARSAPRPGTSSAAMPARCRSATRVLRLRRLCRDRASTPISAAADGRRSARHGAVSVAIAAVIGVPTLRLSGHYFSMATIAVAELVRVLIVTIANISAARRGLGGPAMPRTVFDLSFISALPLLLHLPRACWRSRSAHLVDGAQPHGLLPARHQGFRTCGALARRLGRPHKLYAYMLSGGLHHASPARSML